MTSFSTSRIKASQTIRPDAIILDNERYGDFSLVGQAAGGILNRTYSQSRYAGHVCICTKLAYIGCILRTVTAEFPRSYRASFTECFFYLLISGLGVGGGALGVWYFAAGHDPQTHGAGAVWLTTICALFVVGGGYLLYSMLSMRVTLTADTIEIQTVSGTTVLRREELSSWRLLEPSKGPRILVLVPRNSLGQPVRIRQYFKMDASFLDWLAPLPKRDEQSPWARNGRTDGVSLR